VVDKLREVLDSIGSAADFFGIELKDINQRGVYGNTPLKIATVRGDIDAVRVLLEAGAEVDAVVEEGCTVLWYASAFNYPEIVRILLDYGASLDTRNTLVDQTPLDAAQRGGFTEVMKVLEEYRVGSRARH
jgi:ankyrin repeat protein